jgi:hypothetical protein
MVYGITNKNYSLMENFVVSFRHEYNVSLVALLEVPFQQEMSTILMGIDASFYNVSLKKSYVFQKFLKPIPKFSIFDNSSPSFRVLGSSGSIDSLLVPSEEFINQNYFDGKVGALPAKIPLDIIDYFDQFPLISGTIIASEYKTKASYVISRNALNSVFNLTVLSRYMDLILLIDAPSDQLNNFYDSLNDFTDFSITTYDIQLKHQLNPFGKVLNNALSMGLYYSAITYIAINFVKGVFLDRDEKELIRYLKARHVSSNIIYRSIILSKTIILFVSILIGWSILPFLVLITQFLWLGMILPLYAMESFVFVFAFSFIFLIAGWLIPYALVAKRSIRQISLLRSYSII